MFPLHHKCKIAYRLIAVGMAVVVSFQGEISVFADEFSTAVGVAAAEKEEREKEEQAKRDKEELYNEYFGERVANTISNNSDLFKTSEYEKADGDTDDSLNNEMMTAGEIISGNGLDETPAVLRDPVGDIDVEVSAGAKLIKVGRYYKTYLMPDGKYRSVFTVYPNTYDYNGTEKEIDNTIISSDDTVSINGIDDTDKSYTNTANSIDVTITGDEDAGAVELKNEDEAIVLSMEEADYSKESVSDNAIRYNDVFDNIDIQYTMTNMGVKEDIILLDKTDKDKYTYRLDKKGIIAKEENGSIVIYKNEEEETVSDNSVSSNTISDNSIYENEKNSVSGNDIPFAIITAPVMTDAVGAKSQNINLTLREKEDCYTIDLMPDKTWLNDADRVYPVMIDPTVTIQSQITTYTVTQAGIMYHGGASNYVGSSAAGVARTYMITSYLYQSIWDVAGTNEVEVTDATLRLYQTNDASDSNICIYRLVDEFTHGYANWDNTVGLERIAAGAGSVKQSGLGYHEFDITDTVNGWSTGNYESYGLEIMLDNESKAAVELAGEGCGDTDFMPLITFEWERAGDVSSNYKLDDTTVNIRPMVKSSVNGELQCYGVFADGLATPESALAFSLNDTSKNYSSIVTPGHNKIYPDSSSFESDFPSGTVTYRNRLSNWQTQYPFTSYDLNKLYYINAQAAKNNTAGKIAKSDEFIIYKITRFDTLQKIADYYGVPLNQILFDNKAADMLLVENNTLFIRNPQRNKDKPYEPADLTDDDKTWIDRLLLGRAKHCEYGFEPVNLNTGNFYLSQEDMTYKDSFGDFTIYRNYNSLDSERMGSFGRGFVSLFDESISRDASGNIYYNREDGSEVLFTRISEGVYKAPEGEELNLKRTQIGSTTVELSSGEAGVPIYKYDITREDKSVVTFDNTGSLIKISEKNGAVININHDENGRITGITREGITFPVSLNSFGCVSSVTQPDGGVWSYGYDANGNLTSVTDPEGGVKRFSYDAKHRMLSWSDETGRQIVFNTYDVKGRVIKQIDQAGNVNTLSYDETNRKTITTDANGDKTTYIHDEDGRTKEIIYPDGTNENKTYENGYLKTETGRDNVTITYERDAKGRITKKTVNGRINDENGNADREVNRISTYTYDERGNLIKTVDADGKESAGVFNSSDLPTRTIDADGKEEIYTYDNRGRLISQTGSDGLVTTFTYSGNLLLSKKIGNTTVAAYAYNANGDVIRETDAAGGFVSCSYDRLHRLVSQTTKAGRNTRNTYLRNGLLESVTDGNGNKTTYGYDEYYNINMITNPDGSKRTAEYGPTGDMLKSMDENGNETTYSYDKAHHPVKVTDANGNETRYTYDAGGNLIKAEDNLGVSYRAVYDPTIDVPVSEWDGNNVRTDYEYTSFGEVTKITKAGKIQGEYKLDASGNVIEETYKSGLKNNYTYDGRGNLLSIRDLNGRVSTYEYNIYNEVTKEITSSGRIRSYAYDAAGLATSQTDERGNVSAINCDKDGNIVKITDPNGNTTEYVYDGNENLVSQINADGSTLNYAYDSKNNLIAYADAKGYVTRYSYDDAGNRISVTDALGGTISYGYDALGNMTKILDQDNNKTSITYDTRSNAVKVTDPYDKDLIFTYDGNGNLRSETDENGNKTTYEYDSFNNLIKKINAKGKLETYGYDNAGNLVDKKDALGNRTYYTYDLYGNLTKSEDALGNVTSVVYNNENEVVSITDPKGAKTSFTYDNSGNLIRTTDALGNSSTSEYDKAGNLVKEINTLGYKKSYTYDEVYHMTEVTERDNTKTTLSYDENGNIIKTVDANGNETSFDYDALNRITKVINAKGEEEKYSYDARSNLIAEDNSGALYQYTYDKNNNRISIEDPFGAKTTDFYDPAHNLIKEISPDNSIETYAYDVLGNVSKYTDGEGNKTTYDYDGAGRLVKTVNTDNVNSSKSSVTGYSYDALGRLSSLTDPNGNKTTYAYDAAGNLIKETDALGYSIFYTYDALNRLISTTYPNGGVESNAYDGLGRLISTTSLSGLKTTYRYDEMDRVINQTEADPAAQNLSSHSRSYSYDKNGNLISETDPEDNSTSYGYDELNRVTDIRSPLSHKTTIEYGTLDNINKVTDPEGIVKSYTYDIKGRLTNEYIAGKEVAAYSYDLKDRVRSIRSGNSEITYSYTKNSLMGSVTNPLSNEDTYEYDSLGRLTKKTDSLKAFISYEYDPAGNVTKETKPDKESITYKYDSLNRLISEKSSDSTVNATYSYDEMGNLIKMSDQTGTSSFSYDKACRLIKHTSGSGESVSYTYDAFGNVKELIYPDGQIVTYDYDKNDRLVNVSEKDRSVKYSYDKEGNVTAVKRLDKSGKLTGGTVLTYDKDNRVTRVVNSDDVRIISDYAYGYDEFNNITKEKIKIYAEGKERNIENSYKYDINKELLESISKENGKTTVSTYKYDLAGNRKERKVNDGKNEIITTYSYDKAGRLIKEEEKTNGSITSTITKSYDLNGNLISEKSEGNPDKDKEYAYDAKGRLKAVSEGGVVMMAALYDGLDNRAFTLEYEPVNVTNYRDKKSIIRKRRSGKTGDIDDEGDSISENDLIKDILPDEVIEDEEEISVLKEEEPDEKGDPSFLYAFIYGSVSQIISFIPVGDVPLHEWFNKHFSLSTGFNIHQNETYEYVDKSNVLEAENDTDKGERIGDQAISDNSILDTNPDENVVDYEKGIKPFDVITKEVSKRTRYTVTLENYRKTEYINDINRENEEVLFEKVSGLNENGNYSYIYGLNRENYSFTDTNLTAGVSSLDNKSIYTQTGTFYYTGTGSVSNLISTNRESSISYTYGDFGEVQKYGTYGNVSPFDREYNNPYTYNGEYIHEKLGLQYLRARYYDPSSGSFISKDTYAGNLTDLLSQNRYTYAQNNPINYNDPSGHKKSQATCTAEQQARERALKAQASSTSKSTVQNVPTVVTQEMEKTAARQAATSANKTMVKNTTSSAMMGVPSEYRKILEERNSESSNIYDMSAGIYQGSNKEGRDYINEFLRNYSGLNPSDIQKSVERKMCSAYATIEKDDKKNIEKKDFVNEDDMIQLLRNKEIIEKEVERIANYRSGLNTGIIILKAGVVGTFLIGSNTEIGYAIDFNGNHGFVISSASPSIQNTAVVGMPNGGVYIAGAYIKNNTIYDLEGVGESVGASTEKSGIDLLSSNLKTIDGIQISYGKGVNLDYEAHIVKSTSRIVEDEEMIKWIQSFLP